MTWPDYLFVALFGGLVGAGELVSRYRAQPVSALKTPPAAVYIGVNVAASVGALVLIRQFNWQFGITSGPGAVRTVQILVAGFGAMTLLRSALFVVCVGTEDVPVGPGAFLTTIADTSDSVLARKLDQKRTEARAELARLVVRGMSFETMSRELPVYALALMGNVAPDDQRELAEQIEALRGSDLDERGKSVALGLALMNTFGEHVLVTVLDTFGDDLREKAEGQAQIRTGRITQRASAYRVMATLRALGSARGSRGYDAWSVRGGPSS